MKSLLFSGLLFLFVTGVHADDPKKSPVSIKVVQAADAKGDSIQIQVVNSSTRTIIVDRGGIAAARFHGFQGCVRKGQ